MRKQPCTQLAFVVLLIVTAFPHRYQAHEPDTNNDDKLPDNSTTTTTTTTTHKDPNLPTDDLRKTTLTHVETNEESASNTTPNSLVESFPANKVSKESESDRGANNEEGSKMGAENHPAMLPNTHDHKSITPNPHERARKVRLRDDDEGGAVESKERRIHLGKDAVKELRSDFYAGPSKINREQEVAGEEERDSDGENRKVDGPEQREIDDAVAYGLRRMRDLYFVKEPELYRMGLFLNKNHPGFYLASFRTPSEKALHYGRYGYAALEARKKLAETYSENLGRESPATVATFRSELFLEECPLQGLPRCPPGFERYRTADGSCNNFRSPWRGASMLPMQRFLPPHYEDGIQRVRQSVLGGRLPSPRDISTRIHRDKNREMSTVTSMFMQWGQFLDHDITSSAQARMFNRSVPRCCQEGGEDLLPPELTHPECLPIPVSRSDRFLSRFGVRCIEFVRSAPTSRIDCDLGWREQISQVTAYIDASTVYGSDAETADSLRLFRKGQLIYGRSRSQGPMQPPDPPEGELCRLGAITTDCFKGGDLRAGDQPGLTALHTVWLRYHNRIAMRLGSLNPHWSDEKIYQEARRIVGALIQHITYREFLPIVLGQEVMKLFGLDLERNGYFKGYNSKVNPAPANSFGTAAFRFGHSLVQRSFVRRDAAHRVIRNNVTLHEEQVNVENIWSFGSVDRLLLGLVNQPTQKRDEFITDELTNHLFQSPGFPFGMDLAAINIQRGRDHGIPSYTAWREPCGLVPLRNWTDLERVMSLDTVQRFRSLYAHVDDLDLFSGGLAEKPVRGGVVGPTFACIIAQQFSNLRKGDRFWYENGNFESSFTPAQLQQLRRTTFAHVLCKTMAEIETLQPFVFLSADNFRNARVSCDDSSVDSFDLMPWEERHHDENNLPNRFLRKTHPRTTSTPKNDDELLLLDDYEDADENNNDLGLESRERPSKKRRKTKPTITRRKVTTKSTVIKLTRPTAYVNNSPYTPFKIKLTNVTTTALKTKKTRPARPTNNAPQRRPPPPPKTTTRRPYYQTDGYNQPDYIQPTRRPFATNKPPVDGYLIDFSSPDSPTSAKRPKPTKTQTPGPYHVNINIQFVPTDGQAASSDKVETYDLPTTTRRTKPVIYTKKPARRPVVVGNPYDQNDEDYTKRPNANGGYNSFVTKRPSFSYNIPQSEYGDFHTQGTNVRPVYRPPTNYDTVFEDAPFATSSKPTYSNDNNYNNHNNFNHKIPTMKPVIIPSYLYLSENDPETYNPYKPSPRPTYNRPTTYDRPTMYLRPTMQYRPSEAYKTEDDTVADSNAATYSQILIPQGVLQLDPNFEPNDHFFTAESKQGPGNVTRTNTTNFDEDSDQASSDEDDSYVKIASQQGHKLPSEEELADPVYINSVQQREGELELPDEKTDSDDSPLIQVDIVPSELGATEWKIYNETDDVIPALPVYDFIDLNMNVSCANELPHPIEFNVTQHNVGGNVSVSV